MLLSVSKLCGWYGASQALFGISLEVNEGEVVTLLGRNGAGKSTTLRAIMGLIESRTGSIMFKGNELISIAPEQIGRSGVAYCPEERGIYSTLTVEENLLLPPVIASGGISLAEIYDLFPNLYERRSSPGTFLSGGEQQMLAIARILRTGAKLLLLDEPTEGLAPVIIEQIGSLIRLLKKRGFTVLLVEQNSHFAEDLADRHYLVEHGEIIDMIPAKDFDSRSDRVMSCLAV
jgi:branched-chain amino acid transport system ATP-binding protein